MTPNRVRWEDLDSGTYEDMVSVLISWLYPTAQRIDGSGGDGGRDVRVPTDDGFAIYQLKSFIGRMGPGRRSKVESSLETASQHGPAEWCLVVPIDPTPGELEWFERFMEGYDFKCSWLGKTWLDREMADKPAIARYYAHDGRYALSDLLDVLRAINAKPPPVEEGIVNAAADQMRRVLQKINELDPHYLFSLNLQPDSAPEVTIIRRYKGAENDRPSPLRVRLAFPDTEEGKKAHRDFRQSIDYGTPSVISSEFVSELFLDLPAGLGGNLEGYQLSIASPASDAGDEVEVVLKAVDQNEALLARLPLEAAEVSKGIRGGQIRLRDKSGSVTALARIDVINSHFKLEWSYTPPTRYWPLDLLPAVKFVAALESGAGITAFFNGESLGSQGPGGLHPSDTGEAQRHARFVEHLANVQMKTGGFFEVADAFSPEEVEAIVLSSRLLNAETVVDTWGELRLEVIPGDREPVEKALTGLSQDVRVASDLSINVQGETIPIGRVIQEIESAKLLAWEPGEEGSPPGTTTVILIPADTNTVRRFLDTDPDL